MANKKFSEFDLKTSNSDVQFVVGYNGADNVRIAPSDVLGAYLPLAGGTMTGNVRLNDSVLLELGTSGGFNMFHDGADVTLQNFTGNFIIVNKADNKDIRFQTDNGSGGTTTYFTIDGVNEINQFSKNVSLVDNVKALFGTSSDLQIYHDGSNSYIKDTGTGNLKLRATNLNLQSEVGADYISCVSGGASEIYFNNSKKFETTSTGISVTGDGDFSGDVTIGSASAGSDKTLNVITGGTKSSIKLMETGTVYGFSTLYDGATNKFNINRHNNSVSGTTVLSLNRDDDNATFAGNVFLPDNKYATFGGANNAWELQIGVVGDNAFIEKTATSNGDLYINNNGSGKGIIFQNGGSEKMRLDSSGNLGIGTSIPISKFQIGDFVGTGGFSYGAVSTVYGSFDSNRSTLFLGTTDANAINVGGSIAFGGQTGASTNMYTFGSITGAKENGTSGNYQGYLAFRTTPISSVLSEERMRIDSAGNTIIQNPTGASQSSYGLRFNKTNSSSLQQVGSEILSSPFTTNTNAGDLIFKTANSSANLVERVRINGDGNILFGTTGTPNGTSVYGSGFIPVSNGKVALRMASSSTAAGTLVEFFNPNGSVGNITSSASATAFNTSSDYRLKEDLKDFDGLDKVSKIPVYDFKWKADESRSYGVMAHELEEVLPQAVSGEKDAEEMKSVDYSKIVPLLVKSIQELSAKLEALECQCEKK